MPDMYIPKSVLDAPVNGRFFFCLPYKAAEYNFIKSVDPKVHSVAKKALDQTPEQPQISLAGRIKHFFVHLGMALFLSFPLLNFFPFVVLTLKAKETLPKETPPTQPVVQPLPKIENPELAALPEATLPPQPLEKPLEPILEEQKNPAIEKPSLKIDEKSPRLKPEEKPLPVKAQPHLQTLVEYPPQKIASPIVSPIASPNGKEAALAKTKAEREKERIVARLYYSLFLSELEDLKLGFTLRKEKDEDWSLVMKTLIPRICNQALTLGYAKGTLSRLEVTEANLLALREHLIQKCGEEPVKKGIQGTFNKELKIKNEANPYETIRRAVFQCTPENFKELINKAKFDVFEEVIRIDQDVLLPLNLLKV